MTLTRALPVLVTALLATPAAAAPPVTVQTNGTVEDVATAVEDAIINAGLVVEGQSHVGEMLARTKADVGGAKDIYTAAEVFTFCSATVSRTVMERDPANIQFCPYSVFIYETPDAPGRITVGHRDYAAEGLPEVNALLAPILKASQE